MHRTLWIYICLTLAIVVHGVEIRVATYNIGANLRIPSNGGPVFFDYGLGAPGTVDYESVKSVLGRIDADVIALQEIHSVDLSNNDLGTLAASLGYPYIYDPGASNAFDTSLRVVFISRFPFLSTTAIASPTGARDMTRLIPAVRVDVPGTNRDPLLIGTHLKSGSASSDRFQRAVEMRRLTNYLVTNGIGSEDNFLVLGDFNLSSNNTNFTSLPGSGLPSTFDLGDDISLPINYYTDATAYFSQPSVNRIIPQQLDNSIATFPSSGSTLDLFLVSPIIATRPIRTEIYNSALDRSNSTGLEKAGSPLAAETSTDASDHLALFGDFELDAAPPYAFTATGQTITETFDGFTGNYDPYPWATTGGNWVGTDDGALALTGFRSYGSQADPSLGLIPTEEGGSATASFVNNTNEHLRALRIAFTAEQWRSAQPGTIDTLSAALVVDGIESPLPELAYTASNSFPAGALNGGLATPLSADLTGLNIKPGQNFEIRFAFTQGSGGAPLPTDVFINEFHYDNVGGDEGEFVEVVVSPGFPGNLSDVIIFLYNGNGGSLYDRPHPIDSFTLGSVTESGHRIYSKEIPGIQNGPSEALALVVNGSVTQFISYEGQVLATEGAAEGTTSTDIGFDQSSTDSVGLSSLGLTGSGGETADFSWTRFNGLPFSPGQANSGQTFTAPAQGQGVAIDNFAVTALKDSDGDGFLDVYESIFGTDPGDAASFFLLTVGPSESSSSVVELRFPTKVGRSYTIEWSEDLQDWEDFGTYPGTDEAVVEEFTALPGMPKRFFRVRVSLDTP